METLDRSSSDAGPEEPAPARRHAVARRMALVVAVVLAAALAAVIVALATREEAAERSTDDAVDRFRTATSFTLLDAASGLPQPGVYTATGSGNEFVGFSPLDEPFGPSVPVTVAAADPVDGAPCVTVRLDLNSHHWRQWQLCRRADGAVLDPVGVSGTRRAFPGIEIDNTATFRCSPAPVLVAPQAVAGDQHARSCVGISDAIAGESTYTGTATFVGDESVAVGGTDRPAHHVRLDAELEGTQQGTEAVDLWLDPVTALPLRVAFDTAVATPTPFGAIDYRDVGEVTLTTLEPQA